MIRAVEPGSIRHQILFKGNHDTSRLFGLRATTDTEVDIWLWNIEFLKESIAHVFVIMLPCMNENCNRLQGTVYRLRQLFGISEQLLPD